VDAVDRIATELRRLQARARIGSATAGLQRYYRVTADTPPVIDAVLLSDARIAAVPVRDCAEPLIDLRESAFEVDQRQADAEGHWALLREGAAHRLEQAQRALPAGYRLVVVEGYRPVELQRRYFAEHMTFLRERNPEWDGNQVRRAASAYISPPEVAPHPTGGAVDLTLRGPDGRLCWMGTEVNDTPEESDGACYTNAANICAESRANRALLHAAMSAAGFVNYPTEWWHWSIGERYWAFVTGTELARYGAVSQTRGPYGVSPSRRA